MPTCRWVLIVMTVASTIHWYSVVLLTFSFIVCVCVVGIISGWMSSLREGVSLKGW